MLNPSSRLPFSIISVSLSLLLTACPCTNNCPIVKTDPEVGLSLGKAEGMSCVDPQTNMTRTQTGTSIGLLLRDSKGVAIMPGTTGTEPVDLTLTTPGGTYQFKQPFTPSEKDRDTLPAFQNYYLLCESPREETYTIKGTINGRPVEYSGRLTSGPPPSRLSDTEAKITGPNTAEVEVNTSLSTVVYNHGDTTGSTTRRGVTVGGNGDSSSSDVVKQPDEPKKVATPGEVLTGQQTGNKLPGGNPTGGIDRPPAIIQSGYALSSFSSIQASGTAQAALKSQDVSNGKTTVQVTVPRGHMRDEPYYAEIFTATRPIGPETKPSEAGRADIAIQYSKVVVPEAQKAVDWSGQFSASVTTAKFNGESSVYHTITTSLITGDGFPTARNWNIEIRDPSGARVTLRDSSGAEVPSYDYPRFMPYVVVGTSKKLTPGTYRAVMTSTAPGGPARREQTFNVSDNPPLPLPTAELKLKDDLSGFTVNLSGGPRSHWAYVTETGTQTTVAFKTCITVSTNVCEISKEAGATLDRSKKYSLTLVSTEAPLDLNPGFQDSGWNFDQPVRWAVQRIDPTVTPPPPPPVGDYNARDVDSKTLLEAHSTMQFGLFDKQTGQRVNVPNAAWSKLEESRPGIAEIDPATGLVRGLGTDLGTFKVKANYSGKEAVSPQINLFGLVCAAGHGTFGATFLCKHVNENGQPTTETTRIQAQSSTWNSGNGDTFSENNSQGWFLGETATPATPGIYKFKTLDLTPQHTDDFVLGTSASRMEKPRDLRLIVTNQSTRSAPANDFKLEWANSSGGSDVKSVRVMIRKIERSFSEGDDFPTYFLSSVIKHKVYRDAAPGAIQQELINDLNIARNEYSVYQFSVTDFNADLESTDPTLPRSGFASATQRACFIAVGDVNMVHPYNGEPGSPEDEFCKPIP